MPLLCPKCGTSTLQESMGPSGVLVDLCRTCYGLWMDRGEIYHYIEHPKAFQAAMAAALKQTAPSSRRCPRCAISLVQIRFPGSELVIDGCQDCAGLWLDEGEVKGVNFLASRLDPRALLEIPIPSQAAAPPPTAPESFRFAPPAPLDAGAVRLSRTALGPLVALPNLALRSGGVLVGLYGLLAGFLYFVAGAMGATPEVAVAGVVAGIALNFLLGPFLLDLSLRWFHTFEWVTPDRLPESLRAFLVQLCADQGISPPRVGIITDGGPNAFTYGHTPSNARLVVTSGLIARLDEDELNGVIGHEVGHIVHWDMLVMTAAAVVPVVLYQLYRMLRGSGKSTSGSGKGKAGLVHLALIAYILYVVTDYLVRFLSRVRELHADRFGAEATGKPNALATALVKVAYGLAGGRSKEKENEKEETAVPATTSGAFAQALGIFDPTSAKALVSSSVTPEGFSPSAILGAMQWDLWNPWATWYELRSTHPLPARRIEHLGHQAAAMGQQPLILFNLTKPESYWDEFLVDLAFHFLPGVLALAGWLAWIILRLPPVTGLSAVAGGWAAGYLVRTWFSYRGDFFADSSVSALLKVVKVSRVRGVPVSLKGKVVGRGDPGYMFSEDLMLQDATGMIFVDYTQPMALFEFWFGLTKVKRLQGKEVEVTGWYRRGPVPYLELRTIVGGAVNSKSWTYTAKVALGAVVLAASLFFAFLP